MADTTSNSRATFGLRTIFATMTALAVILIVVVQIPRPALLLAARTAPVLLLFTALFVLLPLTCINLVCVAISRFFPAARSTSAPGIRLQLLAPYKLLWQAGAAEPPSLATSLTIAVACTTTTALLWPLMHEFGLAMAIMISDNTAAGLPILNGIPKLLFNGSFVWRLFCWELFAILRWWCFFGALAVVWIMIAWPWRNRLKLEPISATFRRLLAFAPWLVILEIAFLVGVWTKFASVVPEPSTGFVEGVFSWHLWHWDCWKGDTWINRGLVPTFAVATLFYTQVLRWRWTPAFAAAACAAPPALMLSVAWTVLYLHSFQ